MNWNMFLPGNNELTNRYIPLGTVTSSHKALLYNSYTKCLSGNKKYACIDQPKLVGMSLGKELRKLPLSRTQARLKAPKTTSILRMCHQRFKHILRKFCALQTPSTKVTLTYSITQVTPFHQSNAHLS